MLTAANPANLLMYKFAGLRGGRFARALVPPSLLDCSSFRHDYFSMENALVARPMRAIGQATSAVQASALPASANTEAESRSINANARLTIVIAIVVIVPPGTIIAVSDDHATVTAGMPALAGVVTNDSRLMKQRRALSDLNLVKRISARRYEGASASEKCHYQSSHVHFSSV